MTTSRNSRSGAQRPRSTGSQLESLSFFAGVTLLDTDPSDLPYAPETTIRCGANWRFLDRFKLSLDGSYVSSIYVNSQTRKADTVGSYTLINGKLSYAFDGLIGNYKGELFVAGENLTDVDYEYQPGYPMPGANVMVGLQQEL